MADAPPVYPASDLQRPSRLLDALGSFWAGSYKGTALVQAVLDARAEAELQVRQDTGELFDSLSRLSTPPRHVQRWQQLRLRLSEKDDERVALLRYDGEADYGDGHRYGVLRELPRATWRLPDLSLADVRVITNRITDPSVVLVRNLDFVINDGEISFRVDPETDSRFARREIYADGEVVDEELGLWLFRAEFDHDTLRRQWGYVLGLDVPATTAGRDLLNAFYDAVVQGTTDHHLRQAFAAMTGVPLVREEQETVERIEDGAEQRLVITDQHVYSFALEAESNVAEGDEVLRGQALTDALVFHDLNRGQLPPLALTGALVVGRGLLGPGYFLPELVFPDKEVALDIEEDVDGHTRIAFELGGWPGDVEHFFDELHARGIAAGQTLAHLLDVRPDPQDEPTAANLPATINPAEFLVKNVLRANAALVTLRPAAFDPEAPGLGFARFLRKIVPPQTLLLIVAVLEHAEDPIVMDDTADSSASFLTSEDEETSPGAGTDTASAYQVTGRCI